MINTSNCTHSTNMDECGLCKKRILTHSVFLRCCCCERLFHISCVSVSKQDHKYLSKNDTQRYCIQCNSSIFACNHFADDDEFCIALYDIFSEIPLTFKNFNNMVFNPFNLNSQPKVPLHEADPDIQFYNEINCVGRISSQYYLEDEFNDAVREQYKSDNFSLMHVNIHSLPSHITEVESYLNNLLLNS